MSNETGMVPKLLEEHLLPSKQRIISIDDHTGATFVDDIVAIQRSALPTYLCSDDIAHSAKWLQLSNEGT